MPLERRHKWIACWLKQQYLYLLKNQVNEQYLELLEKNYQRILQWLMEPQTPLDLVQNEMDLFETLADLYHKHQKLSGQGIREYDLLPAVAEGDILSNKPWSASISYKVALDNFRSAFNVGSIFRICDAVGFEEVIIGGYSPGKSNSKVIKTAMGAGEWIPESKSFDLQLSLLEHQSEGYDIIGLETISGATAVNQFHWPQKAIIVLGNEELGISREVMKNCTKFVQIPMFGRKNSMNVANAFSIVAHSICSNKIKKS